MELTFKRDIRIIAVLLLAAAVTQTIYTALHIARMEVPRGLLWGAEGVIFVLLAAFAGAALAEARRFPLVFSAIAFSALLNVVQVGIGHTMFVQLREAAGADEALAPVAATVVSLGFFTYNAAKMLLGLAALALGLARMSEGGRVLAGLTALAGALALVANALVMALGLDGAVPSPVAGGSGVAATVLLALCLLGLPRESERPGTVQAGDMEVLQ